VNGKPFVDWQLELLSRQGYRNFVFCISHQQEAIQEYLGDGSRWNVDITYSLDGTTQLGTGGAIKKALPLLGNKFAVLYGDSYLPIDFKKIERKFIESEVDALMAVYRNENKLDLSNVSFVANKLIAYEKGVNKLNMEHIDYGLTYMRAAVLENATLNSYLDLSEIFHELAKSSKLAGVEVFERFYEIGSINGLQDFSEYIGKVNHEL
jgi:NDP-sugar pyrophosphorylase family protein